MFTRHLANTLELICDLDPARTALIHGPAQRSWRQFDDRAAQLAAAMQAGGIVAGETVAINLYNCPEWLEAYYATLKMRAVPANLNYRYREDELAHVLNDSDAVALIFHASLAEVVLRNRPSLSRIRLWIMVEDRDEGSMDGVEEYEKLIGKHGAAARIDRPADDKFLSYTGGTTGLPRGVSGNLGMVWGIAPRAVNYIFGTSFTSDDDPVEIARNLRAGDREIISLVAPPADAFHRAADDGHSDSRCCRRRGNNDDALFRCAPHPPGDRKNRRQPVDHRRRRLRPPPAARPRGGKAG